MKDVEGDKLSRGPHPYNPDDAHGKGWVRGWAADRIFLSSIEVQGSC